MFLGELAGFRIVQIGKMRLEYMQHGNVQDEPESKELLKKQIPYNGSKPKGPGSQLTALPMAKTGTIEEKKK